jgi:predicted Holliday junction resolvase-like endonuclease
MLKGILGFLLFLFFVIVLILMLTGRFLLKKIRELRKAAEQAAEQEAFNYRTETGRQRQQYGKRQSAQTTQHAQERQQSTQYSQSSRHTQTSTGETIIDHRHQERENRKIFNDTDGEYVDFVEEK